MSKTITDATSFADLGLSAETLRAIQKKGFEEPTVIQKLTIPHLLGGTKDLIARARTGTGKTAAFAIPLIEKLSGKGAGVRALVLVPTRELAIQVTQEIISLREADHAHALPRVAPVYGGAAMSEQLRRLKAGVDIVVGTPGRVMDHLDRKTLSLDHLEYLILDEADEMLDMGFADDIETIIKQSRPERRVLLFSATMPPEIIRVAKRHLKEYETVADETETVTTSLTEQVWLEVREEDKLEALCRIIDSEEDFYGIIFMSTRHETERLAKNLDERGYRADAIHGEITQDKREKILLRFRGKKLTVLVATDVAARGIDIEKLSHVINWSLPHNTETYVHRVGRTGRAGNEGNAITFVTPNEYRQLFRFQRASGDNLKKIKLPAIGEVLKNRRAKILARIVNTAEVFAGKAGDDGEVIHSLAGEKRKVFDSFVAELLGKMSAEDALKAVLFESFGDELDPARYREIKEGSVDMTAVARLSIAVGRRDGASPRSIVELIKSVTHIHDRLINDIEVLDSLSFVSLPFDAAEKMVAATKHQADLPAAQVTKTIQGGGGGGRQSGRPNYRERDGRPPRRDFKSGRDGGFKPRREFGAKFDKSFSKGAGGPKRKKK